MKLTDLHEAATTGFKVQKTVRDNLWALINFAKSREDTKHSVVDFREHSFRVWSRSDGASYKDQLFVEFKTNADAKKVFDEIPGKQLQVSGEFGTLEYCPAKKTNGFLFVMRDKYITVSSDSVLRNTSVWRVKKD